MIYAHLPSCLLEARLWFWLKLLEYLVEWCDLENNSQEFNLICQYLSAKSSLEYIIKAQIIDFSHKILVVTLISTRYFRIFQNMNLQNSNASDLIKLRHATEHKKTNWEKVQLTYFDFLYSQRPVEQIIVEFCFINKTNFKACYLSQKGDHFHCYKLFLRRIKYFCSSLNFLTNFRCELRMLLCCS